MTVAILSSFLQTVKYEGAGDGADAANWECVARFKYVEN